MRVLVTAASRHGSTEGIAEAITAGLTARGINAVLVAPEDVNAVAPYDAVVLGSAVYAGHWLKPAMDFARRFSGDLVNRSVWLFSSGPVGDPSRRLVQKMAADPVDLVELRQLTHASGHRMFAGRLERSGLTRPQRAALALFRGLRGDFRDWTAIDRWAADIAGSVRGSVVAAHYESR
jgi:menaquinone-dependent protoporphyrinogen oxidase